MMKNITDNIKMTSWSVNKVTAQNNILRHKLKLKTHKHIVDKEVVYSL